MTRILGVLLVLGFSTCAWASDPPLTFLELKNILAQPGVTDIESALPALAAKFPTHFRFHTLMYKSLSMQESSFVEPRVIAFGPQAKFIVAFNGGIHQRGGGSFETVEYWEPTHEFLLREVAFKYPGFDRGNLDLAPHEIESETDDYIISKANPAKCLRCHGPEAGPIWATYFLWPGAYGANDDHLHMSFDRASWNPNNEVFFNAADRPHSQGRLMQLAPGFADREVDGMIAYLQGRPAHARYRWLAPSFIEEPLLKFANGEKFTNLDYSAAADLESAQLGTSYEWPSRPNLYFQNQLMKWNQDRIIHRLDKAGLKDAFVSAAWNDLWQYEFRLDSNSDQMLPDLAAEIGRLLATFSFSGPRPSVAQIERQLRANLSAEIESQRHKMRVHQYSFGPASIRFFPYPYGPNNIRFGMEWLGDPAKFYAEFLGLGTVEEADRVAFHIETEDTAALTMLSILLADRGIVLSNFSMTHARRPTFYDDGLVDVEDFLGVRFYP